jgi:hypothetical protein
VGLEQDREVLELSVGEDGADEEDAGLMEAVHRPLSEADGMPALTEAFVSDVLAAIGEMAFRSKRRQADLDAAILRAGLAASRPLRLAAVERLYRQDCIDKVVELSDGGILLSVTALGIDRIGSSPG